MAILGSRFGGRATGRFRVAGTLALLGCLAVPGWSLTPGQDPPEALPEYVLKAGFLFNFAKYIDWPAEAFDQADSPIVIGVVGADPFGRILENTLEHKTLNRRGFSIVRFRDPSEIRRCHLLFVPRSEKLRLPEILKQIAPWPTVSVGEEESFALAGGAINILIEKDRPRLEVNPESARRARVTISSKLLKLATLVKSEN